MVEMKNRKIEQKLGSCKQTVMHPTISTQIQTVLCIIYQKPMFYFAHFQIMSWYK